MPCAAARVRAARPDLAAQHDQSGRRRGSDGHPLRAGSVLNYGMPDLAGTRAPARRALEGGSRERDLGLRAAAPPDSVKVKLWSTTRSRTPNACGSRSRRAVGAAGAAALVPAHRDRSRDRSGREQAVVAEADGAARADGSAAAALLRPRAPASCASWAAEFARDFPKIAGRLGLDTFEVRRSLRRAAARRASPSCGARAAEHRFGVPALHAAPAGDGLSALPGADAVDGGGADAAATWPRGPGRRAIAVPRGTALRSLLGARRADRLRVPDRARRDAVAAGAGRRRVHRIRRCRRS